MRTLFHSFAVVTLLSIAAVAQSTAAPTPAQFIPVCTCLKGSSCTLLTSSCKLVPLSSIQIPGPPGPAGAQGTPGAAATITVGTITTLPAGQPANVENAGTANAALLNFFIPMGEQGNDGVPGPNIPGLTYTYDPSADLTTLSLKGIFQQSGGGNTASFQVGSGVMSVVNGHLQCTISVPGDCNPVVGGGVAAQ